MALATHWLDPASERPASYGHIGHWPQFFFLNGHVVRSSQGWPDIAAGNEEGRGMVLVFLFYLSSNLPRLNVAPERVHAFFLIIYKYI